MYKCLIVGNLRDISRNYNLLYSFHKSNDIEIVGMATNSKFHKKLYGVPHINIENLDEVSFDYAIVVYEYINQYKETIKYLLSNYKNIKIIKYEVFQLPFFDINKYIKLINNPPTIFSNNCNGGVL